MQNDETQEQTKASDTSNNIDLDLEYIKNVNAELNGTTKSTKPLKSTKPTKPDANSVSNTQTKHDSDENQAVLFEQPKWVKRCYYILDKVFGSAGANAISFIARVFIIFIASFLLLIGLLSSVNSNTLKAISDTVTVFMSNIDQTKSKPKTDNSSGVRNTSNNTQQQTDAQVKDQSSKINKLQREIKQLKEGSDTNANEQQTDASTSSLSNK